jgi:ketosteroid isomerase-like protein
MILKHQDVYVALFDQVVQTSGKESFAGTRKLFLSERGGRLKIIGDDYQVVPEDSKSKTGASHPLIAAGLALGKAAEVKVAARTQTVEKVQKASGSEPVEKVRKASGDGSEIHARVNGWLSAWSSKDIAKYGAYYAKDFKSQGGASLQSWLNYKTELNQKYDYIKVTQRNLVVRKQGQRYIATFVQYYDSNALKTVGTKQLVFVQEEGQWKIFRESWQKK